MIVALPMILVPSKVSYNECRLYINNYNECFDMSMRMVKILAIGIPLVIIGFFVIPWIINFIFVGVLWPNPPMPKVRYGEFPFRLVYELNGDEIIIEDTIICEFDGVGWNEATGKYRKWKSHYASGNERIVLLELVSGDKICAVSGSAEYYMGDSLHEWSEPFPDAYLHYANRTLSYGLIIADKYLDTEELFGLYGIKFLSWEPSPPIVNSFK